MKKAEKVRKSVIQTAVKAWGICAADVARILDQERAEQDAAIKARLLEHEKTEGTEQ